MKKTLGLLIVTVMAVLPFSSVRAEELTKEKLLELTPQFNQLFSSLTLMIGTINSEMGAEQTTFSQVSSSLVSISQGLAQLQKAPLLTDDDKRAVALGLTVIQTELLTDAVRLQSIQIRREVISNILASIGQSLLSLVTIVSSVTN